jgi:hypothetical protein
MIRWSVRGEGHVERMRETRPENNEFLGSLKRRDQSEDLVADDMIILKWILGI